MPHPTRPRDNCCISCARYFTATTSSPNTCARQCCPAGDGREWRYSFRPAEENDELPGSTPTIEQAALIREAAEGCQNQGHEEIGWNVEVHHTLLRSIFREPESTRGRDGFNFAICTSARPHLAFLPQDAPAKKVDLCLVAELGHEDECRGRQLSRLTPTLSVNHTDFAPLQLRPILLSMETKTPGKEFDAANLQMGVWHAAQWSFLTLAAAHSIRAGRARGQLVRAHSQGQSRLQSSSAEELEIAKLSRGRVARLPFLPGIVVQGHNWSLVLSTREGARTILWTEWEFGTTQSMQNIFKVVAGLRELAAWFRDVYLPWWRENILDGFGGSDDLSASTEY